jgi:hypothetical protein
MPRRDDAREYPRANSVVAIGFFREAADLIQQMARDERAVVTESSGT